MRNTNERLTAVHQQVQKQRWQHRLLCNRLVVAFSFVAAVGIIVGMGCYMPKLMEHLIICGQEKVNVTASIFAQNGQLGYVVIALVAFSLGVVVTLLSVMLHHKSMADKENSNG